MKFAAPTATRADAYQLMHQGVLALAAVEHAGIRVDMKYLKDTLRRVGDDINMSEDLLKTTEVWKEWRKRFPDRANMNSLDQMAVVLFDVMNVKPVGVGRTATGKWKMDEDALTRLDHPFCRDFLKLKKLHKIKSTYLEGILRETVDGFLHPNFNTHLARTYRSSSDQPNFQNFPIRNKVMGRLIRSIFVPRKGRRIVEVDYKTLEVRIAYCYHKDPVMRRYLTDPDTNMHRDEAVNLFKLDQKQVGDKTTRDAAKNQFVFPQFYGSVWFQCAPAIWERMRRQEWKVEGSDTLVIDHLRKKGITKLGNCDPDWIRQSGGPEPGTFSAHVRDCERGMWRKYATYDQWRKDWYEEYKRTGRFWNFTGFGWEGVLKRNDTINYPVQSAAFHCLLKCLIQIQKILAKRGLKSLIVGQIHDSIILDVVEEEFDEVMEVCKYVMEVWLLKRWSWITIPLEIEVEAAPVGMSWHEKTKVKL